MTTMRQYPIFVDNQVLTKSQLNELFKYLDQQNRLSTNVALIGIGIVCGLEVEYSDDPVSIKITGGVGVTSEGYVIKMKDCSTAKSMVYRLPEGLIYEPFMTDNVQDVKLFELLTEGEAETAEEEGETVTDLEEDFLLDKIVMLFLECFDHNKTSCLGKSCDELGTDRILRVRKLLISEDDLQKILDRTNGGFTIAERLNANWNKLAMPRVHFADKEDINYLTFVLPYLKAIHQVKDRIYGALEETWTGWEDLYSDVYGSNPFQESSVLQLRNHIDEYLFGGLISIPFLGIQYIYDYFKDLILAYDEYISCACGFITECCPDTNLFEKHLFLGRAIADPGEIEYRHSFTASPALDKGNKTRAKLLKYHRRLVDLSSSFNFEILDKLALENEIKTTPSHEKKTTLSQRSIPYYYTDEFGISSSWRFGECREKYLLSYTQHNIQASPANPVRTPLYFDIDDYNFIRVEGTLAKNIDEAEAYVEKYRTQYNLPFSTETIYLGEPNGEMEVPDCLFFDLQNDYATWRHKTLYFLRTFAILMRKTRSAIINRNQYMDSLKSESGSKKKSEEGIEEVDNDNASTIKDTISSASILTQGSKLFRIQDELLHIDKHQKVSIGEAIEDNPANIVAQQIQGYIQCLQDLIKSMVTDLKKFDMDKWVEKYTCLLQFHINMMKAAVAFVENKQQQAMVYIMLLFYCLLYELLAIVAIYPYIGLGTLMDTLKERIKIYREQHGLGRFNTTHTGLEHQAGTPYGGTYVMLYANTLGRKEISDEEIELLQKLDVDIDRILKMLQEGVKGRVVGDFALPYICCDPCSSMENAARPLTPLAVPKCGVVRVRRGTEYNLSKKGATTFPAVHMRMLPHVYDVEAFEVALSPVSSGNSGPSFGNVAFIDRPAVEDPEKSVQFLTYTLDFEKINKALVKPGEDFFLIDEFEYRILDRGNKEVLGTSIIHIFIPVVDRDEDKTVTVHGLVRDKSGQVIPGIAVTIQKSALVTTTNQNGEFVFGNVPVGTQVFVAEGFGMSHSPQTVEVKEGMDSVILIVDAEKIVDDLNDFILTDHLAEILKFRADSTENNLLKKKFIRKFDESREIAEKMREIAVAKNDPVLGKTSELIMEYASDQPMNVNRLNSSYTKQRNELLETIKAQGDNKKHQVDALNVLTIGYLDRLILLQSDGITPSSLKVLTTSSKAFNQLEEIQFGKAYQKWLKETKVALSNQMQEELKENFNIKIR